MYEFRNQNSSIIDLPPGQPRTWRRNLWGMPATQRKPPSPVPCLPSHAWQHYVASGRTDERLRGRLLDPYLEKLTKLAIRRASLCAGRVEWRDLYQEGYLGLVDAAQRFDPDRGIGFWTFAARNALGRMQDYLRSIDPLSRQHRRRKREAADLVAALEQQLGHTPTADEIRDQLGEDVARAYESPDGMNQQLLEDYEGQGWRLMDLVEACVERPDSRLLCESFARELLRPLAMDDQCLVWLWAVRGARMRQLGEVFDHSESWVSQRIAQALALLTDDLGRENLLADATAAG